MTTISNTLKKKSINGHISTNEALLAAAPYDAERAKTVQLLKKCEKNVGMYLGEEINQHLAEMEGSYFNSRDYHYERPVGEQ